MSLDQNESVERTLEEILAELGLLSDPSDVPETSSPEAPASSGEDTSKEEKEPEAGEPSEEVKASEDPVSDESEAPHSEPAAEAVRPVTVSVSTETARPAAEEFSVGEDAAGTDDEESAEEEAHEPSTMVFSPSRLREQMKAAAAAAAAPKAKASPPSSASLKAELQQLSRSGGGHTVTQQLRAQDPVKTETMPRRKPAEAARKKPVEAARREPAVKRPPQKISSAKELRWQREVIEWVKALLIALVGAFIIFFVLIRIVNVEGTSMQPALEPGDRLIISGLFYEPENGDIVVTSSKNGLNKPLVKRVIALGGQTVDLDEEGRILINGLALDETYLDEEGMSAGDLTFPLTVPEKSVFLLGDNREVSVDSRSDLVGMISEKELKGKVLFRFWPMDRIGAVK